MAKGDAVGVLNGEANRLEAGPTACRLRGDPVCCVNVRCRFGRARKGRCDAILADVELDVAGTKNLAPEVTRDVMRGSL